jgi:LuxR family transcriptional regulator, maltose regulon positive regulatory protein
MDSRRQVHGVTTLDNASPLLETKLYVPRLRRGQVARPGLSERLSRGAESKLTLISAPAGFGKTTLLAEWLAATPARERSAAWLSLDPSDNTAASFWPYLIAALQTVTPSVGAGAASLMKAPQPPPIETVLAILLNELSEVPTDIVLVLDDYHVIDAHDVDGGMAYLLEHLPPQMHVVIATRADPALPLSRMRARGELVEIRAADLRFTPDEAASYLNDVMGLDLAARDVAALEGRTEGWIAALQLAALSMQGRDDVAGFIAGFSGDDRYIVDYLVEEVLHRQPEALRSFLLKTSILSRMCGPLCDAVTGEGEGRTTLEALERQNLFVVSLDDRRQWYRYHHLFGDVLQARLLDEQPDRVADLHRRASEWYEQEGERAEAIRHAMAGKDFARAADLVELAMPATGRDRQEATLRRWLEALPDELIRARPVLSNGYAGSILVRGATDGVDARLRDAERWLDLAAEGLDAADPEAASMVVVDEDAFRRLPGAVAIHRAGLALLLGDVAGTIAHARRALDLVAKDDDLGQGAASALLGLAQWSRADLDAASSLYSGAIPRFERIGHLSDAIGLSLALADMRIAQGRLHDAMKTYERGLELATGQGAVVLRGAADMHVGMSEILRERDDLAGATQHLDMARDLGDENGLPQNSYRSRVAAARILLAEGDPEAALGLLAEAGRLYATDFSPDVRPVDALKARVWIAQGKLSEAMRWAHESGVSAGEDLSYVREFEHITLARLILAEGARDRSDERIGEAIGLLERLLKAAEEGGRTGSVIEILVVEALAHRARNDVPGALASLERAVALAEPEGYVRIVADEGPTMAGLLRSATQQRDASGYMRRLLAATVTPASRAPVDQPLIEPLSERELDVLRLLESDLDGPDIAGELTVSLATVRTHSRNIYAKLGVNNRRAAVRRAAELGLLSRTRDGRPGA